MTSIILCFAIFSCTIEAVDQPGNRGVDSTAIFKDVSATNIPAENLSDNSMDAKAADVDGGGDLDLYFANAILFQKGNSSQDRLLLNQQGSFIHETSNRLPAFDSNTLDADFFDIDRDGDFDIVAGDFGSLNNETGNYTSSNFARVFINDGSGFYTDQTADYFPENFSPTLVDFEIVDFNADGLSDIYVANFRSPDVFLLQRK